MTDEIAFEQFVSSRRSPQSRSESTWELPDGWDGPTPAPSQPVIPAPAAAPHFGAANVYFSDAEPGWAIGDAQCESSIKTDCATLIATDDGPCLSGSTASSRDRLASWHRPT